MTSASEVQSDRNRPYMSLQRFLYHRADMLQPIPPEALPAFQDTPVFSSRYGWAMVNAIEGELLFASGMRLSLADAAEVYVLPPAFATPGAAVTTYLINDLFLKFVILIYTTFVVSYHFFNLTFGCP